MTAPTLMLLALASAASTTEPLPTLVFDVRTKPGVSAPVAAAMTEVLHGVFAADASRRVLGRRELAQLASFEAERQAMGCGDDSCLIEVAEALNVDRLVLTSVSPLGSKYLVIVRELDARALRPYGRVEGTVGLKASTFIDEVRRLATEVRDAGAGGGETGDARLVVRVEPAGGKVLIGGRAVGADQVELGGLATGVQTVTVEHGAARAVFTVPVSDASLSELRVTMALDGATTTPAEEEGYGSLAWQRWAVGGAELGAGTLMLGHGLLGVAFAVTTLAIQPPGSGSGGLTPNEVIAGYVGVFAASGVAIGAGALMLGAGGWTFVQAPSAPLRPPVHKATLVRAGEQIELEVPDAGG